MEQTNQKEPVTLPKSEENLINLIETDGAHTWKIKPKVQKKFDHIIEGPRIVFREIISPDEIIRKRERQIYDLRSK